MLNREKIEQRIKNFRLTMKRNHLPITPQKLAIFQYLASTESHPSAAIIFEKMKYYFENISFATVYKNLKKFHELNLLRKIEMKNNTVHYDAGIEPHHHIINLETNDILDIFPEEMEEFKIPKKVHEFEIESVSINFFVKNKKKVSRYEKFKQAKNYPL